MMLKYTRALIVMVCLAWFPFSFCTNSSKTTEQVTEAHPNGKVRYRFSLNEEGNIHGLMWEYDSLGNLYSKTDYSDGVLHGEFKQYYSSGELYYSVSYERGQINDTCQWFYPTGELKMKIPIENSLRNGIGVKLNKNSDTIGFYIFRDNLQMLMVENIGTDSIHEHGFFPWAWSYNKDTLCVQDTFELFVTSAVPPGFEDHVLEVSINDVVSEKFDRCYFSKKLRTVEFYSHLEPGRNRVEFTLRHPFLKESNKKTYSKNFYVYVDSTCFDSLGK